MKIPKAHQQLHVPDDIIEKGVTRNYHSGPREKMHITTCKDTSKLTQRRAETHCYQSAVRLSEHYMLEKASVLAGCQSTGVNGKVHNTRPVQGTKAAIIIEEDGFFSLEWITKKPRRSYPEDVLYFVHETCSSVSKDGRIYLFSEHTRPNGQVF